MVFLKIILYVIIFLFPVVPLARDRIDKNFPNQSRKYKVFTYTMIITYFILLIPAALVFIGDLKDQSAQREKISELTNGNAKLLSRIDALRDDNTEAYKELAKKSDKIADLNRDIAGIVSGGDSYCSVAASMPDSKNRIRLIAESEGKYPVYDVTIEIVDVEKTSAIMQKLTKEEIFDALSEGTIETFQARTILRLGTMGPHKMADLGAIKLSDTNKQTFSIIVTARNGFFHALHQYRRINGKWVRAIQSTKNGKTKEQADPEFPRNDKGKIQWQ